MVQRNKEKLEKLEELWTNIEKGLQHPTGKRGSGQKQC